MKDNKRRMAIVCVPRKVRMEVKSEIRKKKNGTSDWGEGKGRREGEKDFWKSHSQLKYPVQPDFHLRLPLLLITLNPISSCTYTVVARPWMFQNQNIQQEIYISPHYLQISSFCINPVFSKWYLHPPDDSRQKPNI